MVYLTVLAGVAGIALGFWAGFAVGKRFAGKPGWMYWLLNLAALVVGLLVNAVGLTLGYLWLTALGLALFAGGISGLKYGYGPTRGLWMVTDALFGAARSLPGAAGPKPYEAVPYDEPGFVSAPLGRDREVEETEEPRRPRGTKGLKDPKRPRGLKR